MNPGWKYRLALAICAALTLSIGQKTVADDVQLERIDNAVRARLDRVETQLAERRWDEAVENLRQLADITDGGLVEVSDGRFVDLGRYCQTRLAALPPEALKIYRDRVDPLARQWYETGIEQRDRRLLQRIVDQAFASSYGDDALLALGDMDLESGRFAAARWNWSRILLPEKNTKADDLSRNYPDTNIGQAAIRARIVLASILAGRPSRGRAELARLARLFPNAKGRLGERQGQYVEQLELLLTESRSWPPAAESGWTTFAGNPQRNKTAEPLAELGEIAWRHKLPGNGKALSTYPMLFRSSTDAGRIVLFNNQREILALRLDDGQPAWGRSAAIYRDELPGATNTANAPESPCTMTVFRDRLYARMGSAEQGYLVCLDLAAEGRLLWKIEPEEGWAFDGSPLADGRGVYVAMSRPGVRRQAFAVGLEPDTGRIRWRRFICGAENSAGQDLSHNLLTLADGTICYNTNLGAVVAIRTDDGRIQWLNLYPRESSNLLKKGATAGLSSSVFRGFLAGTAGQASSGTHYSNISLFQLAANVAFPKQFEPNPCLFDGERLFVAPTDSSRIFAFDAFDGRLLWKTGTDVENAHGLLGATESDLIVSGERLYWIGLTGNEQGKVKHVWPDSPEQFGFGRGLITDNAVLWPTRDKLHIFDRQTTKPLITLDLKMRGTAGGNLLSVGEILLIATDDELIAIKCRVRETHQDR